MPHHGHWQNTMISGYHHTIQFMSTLRWYWLILSQHINWSIIITTVPYYHELSLSRKQLSYHDLSFLPYSKTMPYYKHVLTILLPYSYHILTILSPYYHIITILLPYYHILTVFLPYSCHISARFLPYSYHIFATFLPYSYHIMSILPYYHILTIFLPYSCHSLAIF